MAAPLTLEQFDCKGDASTEGSRWERWKIALKIYLEAAQIVDNAKKKAYLLHLGGIDLQEIYANIPGMEVEKGGKEDVFELAIKKLDQYFAPVQSKTYERHVFRLLKQEPNEKFDKFLIRLRQQAFKCKFSNQEENIIDQIAEKGTSQELRKKILQMGDSVTMEKIITEANALEMVNTQLTDFSRKNNEEINAIKGRNQNGRFNKFTGGNTRKGHLIKLEMRCTRCGSLKHGSNDLTCPARSQKCHGCDKIGHFRAFCRSEPKHANKRKWEERKETDSNKYGKRKRDHVNNIENGTEKDTEQDETNEKYYVFHIDDDEELDCAVGGVSIKMLIDSGCKQNLITMKTWEYMKKQRVQVQNQIGKVDKEFMAYGSSNPLKSKGSFEAMVKIGNRSKKATFYVMEDGTRNLLGKMTAIELGILKIGLEINNVEGNFSKFKDIIVDLPIDETVTPVAQPYRRIPIPLEGKIQDKIQDLINRDIIEPVTGASRWVSPIVPILKENGEVRLCVDMRRANTAIVREKHPLPTMDSLLPKIRGAKFYSKLDIKDAFHQLEIHPNSRYITTFISSKGLFRYKRLMFGISCAPEIFQKTLERILLGCEGVVNFIDDILVFGRDLVEHNERLNQVLTTLKKYNVVLKDDKCVFKTEKVSFLGHELSEQGVRPLQKYVTSIQEFRSPVTVAELQSFLGLVNFVSKWIPNLATRSEPLKEILRNRQNGLTDIRDKWSNTQQQAFESLKSDLTNIPTLGYYNVNDRTVVIADASPVGLGGVLVQINHKKEPRIIAYGHKTLTDCERRYCQTEKEALALVWAVEHFNVFLFGKAFDLVTDHKPLEVIFGPKSKPCARIERWILRLQSYNYTVIYKSGKSNIADPLSRLGKIPNKLAPTQDSHIHQIVEYSRPIAVSTTEIMEKSSKDPEIQMVREGIFNHKWNDNVKLYKIFENELCFYENILLRGSKIVIPKILRDRVLKAAHEGHPGIVAMKARLRSKVWWPKCDRDAENLVKSCTGCTLVSAPDPPNPLKRRELPVEAWIDIAIDLMGPLPNGDYLFVAVDYYSRYTEIKICRQITSAVIVSFLKEIFSRVGNPVTITADNGKQFVSKEFKEFCDERNIVVNNTIPYWPQQNGEVERQNRSILKRLKIGQAEGKNLRDSLEEYLMMYNSTPHTVTGQTPSELFYKRKFRDKIPMLATTTTEVGSEVRDRDKEMKIKGKEYADRKRKAKDHELEPGDKVFVKNMTKNNKLSLNFETDPHTVEKSVGGDVQLTNDKTGQKLRRNVVHLKKINGEWKVADEEEVVLKDADEDEVVSKDDS